MEGILAALAVLGSALGSHGEGAPSQDVSISVQGRVERQCGIGPGGLIDLGHLTGRRVEASARFDLYCNTPFDLRIVAERGALEHARTPEGSGPYAGRIAYDLDLTIPLRTASGAGELHANFRGRELAGEGRTLRSGAGVAAAGGRIEVSMRAGAETHLAGDYQEAVLIRISPIQ